MKRQILQRLLAIIPMVYFVADIAPSKPEKPSSPGGCEKKSSQTFHAPAAPLKV